MTQPCAYFSCIKAAKAYEKHVAENGAPDSHAKAKEIAARTVNKHRREEGRTPNRTTQGTGNPTTSLEARSKRELYNRARELDALSGDAAAARARTKAKIPLGRYGTPEEFGRTAAFLLSPAASYLTGIMLPIDGGMRRSI